MSTINKSNQPLTEPEYIQLSEDIFIFRENITPEICNVQIGHYNSAFDALSNTLFLMYGSTSITKLFERCLLPNEVHEFSKKLSIVLLEINTFKKTTCAIILSTLKKILKHTSISPCFINRINIIKMETITDKNDITKCLPSKYKSPNNPAYNMLIKWSTLFKQNTRIKASATVLQIFYFIIPLLNKLGYNIEFHTENYEEKINENIDDIILKLERHVTTLKHYNWTKMFFKVIFNTELLFIFSDKNTTIKIKNDIDEHRISADELDMIYNTSKKDIRNELFILLLTTTGMRIGGLANIKLSNVSKIVDDTIIINDTGRTIEKNNKWFTFMLNVKVKLVLWKYITEYRKATYNCDYLFIGQKNGLSTHRIRELLSKICKDSGLEGKRFHPHSFRHSFAHILLESGNNPECVAKLMGHSSSKITEQYYLKESAAEVSKRANIPWLDKEQTKQHKTVPLFLRTIGNEKSTDKELKKRASKKDKYKKLMELSKGYSSISTLNVIEE
jgi:integrase